jgi:hypothetical protein
LPSGVAKYRGLLASTRSRPSGGAAWVTVMSTFRDVLAALAGSPRRGAMAIDRKNKNFPLIVSTV